METKDIDSIDLKIQELSKELQRGLTHSAELPLLHNMKRDLQHLWTQRDAVLKAYLNKQKNK